MDIGIPAEGYSQEYRVGLTPMRTQLLTRAGHRVYVANHAGEGAGYANEDYERAGARIVYDPAEVYQRADIIFKVLAPEDDELNMLRDEQTICAFWGLPARTRDYLRALNERRITAVAWELLEVDDGRLPVLHPLSEIAGRMAPQVAAHWLQRHVGGHGALLSGIAGIPPLDVVVIGCGVVGFNAARTFYGMGARVMVLDNNLERLREVQERFDGRISSLFAIPDNIAKVGSFADVLVTAAQVRGERAPVVFTREMVANMRDGSVILDIAIDQGGCVETSRPTIHQNPVFVEEGVTHYCVPNMPSVVSRTATRACVSAAWPYIEGLTTYGVEDAMAQDSALSTGIAIHGGEIRDPKLAMINEEVGA